MLVGLDVLSRPFATPVRKRLAETRFGILTHAAAVDRRGKSSLAVLRELGLQPSVVFSPEHGWDGLVEAEVPVQVDDAPTGGARLVSLYGSSKGSLAPSQADLDGLGVLLVDLVDVGSRYYTYVWTALLAIRAAAEAGVHVIVLDRPNPTSGDPERQEGAPQEPHLLSFVGLEPVPIRHSLTIAELLAHALLSSGQSLGPDGLLSFVPTEGWKRLGIHDLDERPFVAPSPNMPTRETALVYPGGCLLEATNLSEGRGTTRPFQLIGAPFLDGERLAAALGEPAGAWIRPTRFRPAWGKHAGEICSGILLHVKDEREFRPVRTYLHVLAAARALSPERFELLTRPYEFESEHPAFDLLTGTERARELLESGASGADLAALVCPVESSWQERVLTLESEIRSARATTYRAAIAVPREPEPEVPASAPSASEPSDVN